MSRSLHTFSHTWVRASGLIHLFLLAHAINLVAIYISIENSEDISPAWRGGCRRCGIFSPVLLSTILNSVQFSSNFIINFTRNFRASNYFIHMLSILLERRISEVPTRTMESQQFQLILRCAEESLYTSNSHAFRGLLPRASSSSKKSHKFRF